ncbi:MAG: SH3 domain-containing protein [Anaerolineae bacterium]|nr:SH3 domain-containing protein [Anaerolineae bacterium]
MNRITLIVCILFFGIFADVAAAQEDSEICSPDDISARVDRAIANYQEIRVDAPDMGSALDEVDTLARALANVQDLCANIASDQPASAGSGTIQDPFTFGTVGDTGEGFSIQLTGFIRPADQVIRNENRFNDRPGDGEVYVIVEVTVQCDKNFDGRCETNYFDFEMTGDKGTIYEPASVVYENKLDIGLFAGGTGTGGLPFLIRAGDTNLKLLYRANRYDDEYIAFEATPSLANGVEVTASASVNVRSGPGTNFSVAGNLPAGEASVAFGRNADGTWLQIQTGWVFTELVTTSGDVEKLPLTSQ